MNPSMQDKWRTAMLTELVWTELSHCCHGPALNHTHKRSFSQGFWNINGTDILCSCSLYLSLSAALALCRLTTSLRSYRMTEQLTGLQGQHPRLPVCLPLCLPASTGWLTVLPWERIHVTIDTCKYAKWHPRRNALIHNNACVAQRIKNDSL